MLSKAIRFLNSIGRAVCLLGVLSASLAWASVGGRISGTVKDPSGNLIVNATVTVRETGTGLLYTAHSDKSGYYIFPVLPGLESTNAKILSSIPTPRLR
jgi:hypothetical protein